MTLRAILLMIFLIPPSLLFAQDFSTTIHKTAQFSDTHNAENELRVYNINGSITVEGYDGDQIQVTADEQINGNKNEIQRAKSELHFKVERSGNKVFIYLDAPFIEVNHHNGNFSYNVHRNGDEGSYDFLFNIHIRVPKRAAIYASTINKGDVSINNTSGDVIASNINGDLKLNHIAGKTEARTINGNITVRYDESPEEDSKYHTINGKIEAFYPSSLSADIKFKSMHGDLYTDFDDVKRLKTQVQSNTKSGGRKTTYQVNRFAPIRIGNGGPVFHFKVLNGDVYIKKIQS